MQFFTNISTATSKKFLLQIPNKPLRKPQESINSGELTHSLTESWTKQNPQFEFKSQDKLKQQKVMDEIHKRGKRILTALKS